jgi:NitT/TauT family transport system substrate-binding protein
MRILCSKKIVVIAGMCFTVVITVSEAVAQLKKVRMGISALSASYTASYIAKDTGLFKKHGLDVELILIDTGPTVHALIAGDLQVAGVGGSRIVSSAVEGSGLRILAATNNRQPYKLVVPAGVRSPSQLIGKKVGVGAFGGLDDTAMRYALRQLGLDPNKDVTIIVAGGKATRFAALTQGAIAAIVIDPPYTLDAKKMGLNFLFDFLESSPKTVYGTISAKDSYVQQNPEMFRNLLKAHIEAVQYYKTHKPESIKIMAKYMRIPLPGKLEEMEETYDAFVRTASCKPYVELEGVAELLREIAPKNPKAKFADPSNFIDSRILRELDETGYIDSVCK